MFCEMAQRLRLAYKSNDGVVWDRVGRFPVQTLTEIVAAVVVHSSAVAYSHFGVTLDTQQIREPVPAERTVARTAVAKRPAKIPAKAVVKATKSPVADRMEDCPETRGLMVKA